jgi:hypothetical protein
MHAWEFKQQGTPKQISEVEYDDGTEYTYETPLTEYTIFVEHE